MREAQERPNVIAYFDPAANGVIYFVVNNSGNSPAVNVEVRFDDPAPIDFANRPLDQVSLFQKPITFLPPGQQFRQLVDVGHKLLADDRPTVFRTTVLYESVEHDTPISLE